MNIYKKSSRYRRYLLRNTFNKVKHNYGIVKGVTAKEGKRIQTIMNYDLVHIYYGLGGIYAKMHGFFNEKTNHIIMKINDFQGDE